MTSIEWTDVTWNPLVGCTRVSAGCEHCYAERFVHRGMAPQHRGLTVMRKHGPGWTGEVRLVESKLDEPLRWTKPRRVFVNSLSDLFHESVPDAWIDRIFARMQATPGCTFQVLSKRAERMRAYLSAPDVADRIAEACSRIAAARGWCHANEDAAWPLPNAWLGVSVEDQKTADERIPQLLETPAAIRWVSYEPALGPVDFEAIRVPLGAESWMTLDALHAVDGLNLGRAQERIDWIVVGGESGPGARPFDVAWMASAIRQCREASVPVFAKQLGANVVTRNDDNFTIEEDPPDPDHPHWPMELVHEDRVEEIPGDTGYQGAPVRVRLRDRKGGDMAEWRSDLRVREMPEARHA